MRGLPSQLEVVVDELKSRIDLVALIGRDIELARCGNHFRGRSPENADTTPSFVVWPDSQRWCDYSGGGERRGDCLDYLQWRRGCTFEEAVHELARDVGVEVPQRVALTPAEVAAVAARRSVEALLDDAAEHYMRVMPDDVKDHFLQRRYGFSAETVERFRIGWADGQLHLRWADARVAVSDQLATGLVVRTADGRLVDFFQGRVVFPFVRRGRVVSMTGRKTDRTPDQPWEAGKYRRLPVHGGARPDISPAVDGRAWFNRDAIARATDVLILTEGVPDVIAAASAGFCATSPGSTAAREDDLETLARTLPRGVRVVIVNDAEIKGAGDKAALAWAHTLGRLGVPVRIGRIPREQDVEKVDLNDLVRTSGPEALKAVVARAVPLSHALVERTPEGTPVADLRPCIEAAVATVSSDDVLELESLRDLISTRFGVRKSVVDQMVRAGADAGPLGEDGLTIPVRGQVWEEEGHYEAEFGNGRVVISSFRILPKRRVLVDGEEQLVADARTDQGRRIADLRFPRGAWHSSAAFHRALGSLDLQWTGADANVQGVLRLASRAAVPVVAGTRQLGYATTPEGCCWVSPSGVLYPEGQAAPTAQLEYVPSGSSLEGLVRFDATLAEVDARRLAAEVLPRLLELNEPDVVLPVLGWFFATPVKPRLLERHRSFPILFVWGTAGSGKTSLIRDVFWPLFGVESDEPFSCTETEFPLIRLLAASTSVPAFVDEYRPYDTQPARLATLHRLMRRVYGGESEERGRADQSTVTYSLQTPMVFAGEARPTETAIMERVLSVRPRKEALASSTCHREAMAALVCQPLSALAPWIVRHVLGCDTLSDLAVAARVVDEALAGRETPIRIRKNFVAMALGLAHLSSFASRMGVELPPFGSEVMAGLVSRMLDDLMGGEARTSVKNGFDLFVEELPVLAGLGHLHHGIHYVVDDGRVALHLKTCWSIFSEHARRGRFEGEVPSRISLRRMAEECQQAGGYVVAVDEPVTFSTGLRQRALVIDVTRAADALEFPGLPGARRDAE